MRIHFIDTILESHVPDSLIESLRELGHTVETTGRIWHGSEFPKTSEDRARLRSVVDDVIRWRPDAVFVMRACALLPREVDRLRRRGITTVVWYSDDPVFFRKQGEPLAGHYDITLHTATERILAKYEEELGERGLGMQFWTSQSAFPRLYDAARCDFDVLFIGNTHTPVRQWRYDWIAGLPLERAMYGLTNGDPAGIVEGVLDDDAELARACARGRFGLSVGQRFEDYEGTAFDFEGLAELGEFPLPSRIVQLAAVGVPIVHLVKFDEARRDLEVMFPAVQVVGSDDELVSEVRSYLEDPASLSRLAEQTHAWFTQHYSAASRARFVHELLMHPGKFEGLSVRERAFAFLDYPPLSPQALRATRLRVRSADGARAILRRAKVVPRRLVRLARRVLRIVRRVARWLVAPPG